MPAVCRQFVGCERREQGGFLAFQLTRFFCGFLCFVFFFFFFVFFCFFSFVFLLAKGGLFWGFFSLGRSPHGSVGVRLGKTSFVFCFFAYWVYSVFLNCS